MNSTKYLLWTAGIISGVFTAPFISHAQINSAQILVKETPQIDSVSYSCASGAVAVHLPATDPAFVYSVLSIQPAGILLPSANNTGMFNLAGATHATFRVDNNGCFADYALTFDCGGAPLPANFLSFDARLYQKNKGYLEWKIAQETKVDRYEVEQSSNGVTFEQIARVAPENANSAAATIYHTIDNELYTGINYYRIRQVDQDGRVFLSEIRTIAYYPQEAMTASIYPNPANEVLYFECIIPEDGNVTLWIMDNLSRVVAGKKEYNLKAGKNKIPLRLEGLADGPYFLGYKADSDQQVHYFKFIRNTTK